MTNRDILDLDCATDPNGSLKQMFIDMTRRPTFLMKAISLLPRFFVLWVVAMMLGGCANELSEKPSRIDPPSAVSSPATSSVSIRVSFPYAEIQRQLQELVGSTPITSNGDVHLGDLESSFTDPIFHHKVTLYQISIDAKWDVQMQVLTNQISVGRRGNLVHLHVPVHVTGGAGIEGDLAKLISLGRKSFDTSFSVEADIGATLSPDYQPIVTVSNVDLIWMDEPQLEVVGSNTIINVAGIKLSIGPYKVDIANETHDKLRDAIRNALQNAASGIKTDVIRSSLASYWRSYSLPINFPPKSHVYVNLTPLDLAASGLIANSESVDWLCRLRFQANISDEEDTPIVWGLPDLGVLTDKDIVCDIKLPITLSYGFLKQVATDEAVKYKTIQASTSIGQVSVDLTGIDIYPHNPDLTCGVDFVAKLPTDLLSAKGSLWVLGDPTLLPNGHSLKMDKLTLYDKIDNPLWGAGIQIAYPKIISSVDEVCTIDFQNTLDKGKQAVVSSLASIPPPFNCVVEDPDFTVSGLSLNPVGVELDSHFTGKVTFVYHRTKILNQYHLQ